MIPAPCLEIAPSPLSPGELPVGNAWGTCRRWRDFPHTRGGSKSALCPQLLSYPVELDGVRLTGVPLCDVHIVVVIYADVVRVNEDLQCLLHGAQLPVGVFGLASTWGGNLSVLFVEDRDKPRSLGFVGRPDRSKVDMVFVHYGPTDEGTGQINCAEVLAAHGKSLQFVLASRSD